MPATYSYGLRFRPAGYGTVPDGRIATDRTPRPTFPHGTVTYDRKLTAEEVAVYQLTPDLVLSWAEGSDHGDRAA